MRCVAASFSIAVGVRSSGDLSTSLRLVFSGVRGEGVRTGAVRGEGVRTGAVRGEGVRTGAVRGEGVRAGAVRGEGVTTGAVRAGGDAVVFGAETGVAKTVLLKSDLGTHSPTCSCSFPRGMY